MLYLKRILLKNTQFLRLPQYSTNSLLSMKEQKYYSDSKVPFPARNKGKKQYYKKQDNSQIYKKPAQHSLNDYLNNEKSKLQVNSLIEKLVKKSEMGKTSRPATFEEEITLRRDQAHRTILFKIKDSGTLPDQLVHVLLSMCVSLTNVSLIGTAQNPFVLIEFKSHQCVQKVLENTNDFDNEKSYPTSNRIIYFTGDYSLTTTLRHPIQDLTGNQSNKYPSFPKDKKQNLTEQIQSFYTLNRLRDIDYRVRYFIASILDDTVKNLSKDAVFFPFGSSCNQFGNVSSDLDMFLDLGGHCLNKQQQKVRKPYFFFISKEQKTGDKFFFDTLSALISKVTPKLYVHKVLPHAKVPIINMQANMGMDVSCDISMGKTASFLMTKLFWTYSQYDSRVAPLVMTIRTWAMYFHITTNTRPCPNLTNYQLTVLILYYLINMRADRPVLMPTDKFVTDQILSTDESQLEQSHRNTSIMEPGKLKQLFVNVNEMGLSELLRGFFEFYSTFDFDSVTIALTESPAKNKTGRQLYIENPFERMSNTALYVSTQEIESFKKKCAFSENFLRTSQTKSLMDMFNQIDQYRLTEKRAPSANDLLTREMHDYNF